MSIESYLQAVPKAELHVHLEGSIQPSTLLLLAKRNGMRLPADTVEGVKSWFVYRDFPHFIEVFVAVTRCLKRSEDPILVAHLAQRRIPLEVSPTSNICLGIYESLARHPLRRLYEAEVPLTVNSDDPPLFNTTLCDELSTLVEPFHLDIDAIDEIVLNGVRFCFLPAERRQAIESAFQAEMDALKVDHGLPSPPSPQRFTCHQGQVRTDSI